MLPSSATDTRIQIQFLNKLNIFFDTEMQINELVHSIYSTFSYLLNDSHPLRIQFKQV